MEDDNHTKIAVLETKVESLERRLSSVEGVHKKVFWGAALGLIGVVTWLAKIVADKSGIGQ